MARASRTPWMNSPMGRKKPLRRRTSAPVRERAVIGMPLRMTRFDVNIGWYTTDFTDVCRIAALNPLHAPDKLLLTKLQARHVILAGGRQSGGYQATVSITAIRSGISSSG